MNDQIQVENKLNLFWPFALLAASLIIVLGQNLWTVRDQKAALTNAIDQQRPALEQSRQVQVRFQKMMVDLLQMAQTDAEAKTIVTKYGIAITPPAR